MTKHENLKGSQELLNSISSDIMKTQTLIRNCGVSNSVRVFCEYRRVFISDPDLDNGHTGDEIHYEEYLVWDKIERGTKLEWALLYEETEQKGYLESDGQCVFYRDTKGPPITIQKKPLIETPVAIRKKMYIHLDKFINEVCKEAKIDKFQETQKNLQDTFKKMECTG